MGYLEGPPDSIGSDFVVVGGPMELAVKDDAKVLEGGDCVYALVSSGTISISMQEDKVRRGGVVVRMEEVYEGEFGQFKWGIVGCGPCETTALSLHHVLTAECASGRELATARYMQSLMNLMVVSFLCMVVSTSGAL